MKMNVTTIQPAFARRLEDMPALVDWLCARMDACDESTDLIVMPEGCNGMCKFDSVEQFHETADRFAPILEKKASETAARCRAVIAINMYIQENGVYYNATRVFDPEGRLAGTYLKQHLPESEWKDLKIGGEYAKRFHVPYTLDLNGVRYGFLTCYDCYFNEYIQHLATQRPDVILVSSLQRGEQSTMLELEMRNAAFICNAYAVRSSVSMGDEKYPYGANSMIVSPEGQVLAALGQKVGCISAQIDPEHKHFRPDTYNKPLISNERFIEKGRTPWAYRACGPSVRLGDERMPYPHHCARKYPARFRSGYRSGCR